MKYYIPTSSLNLDNILQSESISPYSFYAKRITGYNSIEVLPELRGIDKLILFSYPVRFTINDPNRYNFPLLIEIEDGSQLTVDKLNMESEGVYSFSTTFYLTPTNCRFFFYAERDYNLTTINTKSNKAIKYYENYQIYPTASILQPKLKEFPPLQFENKSSNKESHETKFDKRKGLLYGYLLGQTLSVSPELAHQNKLSQDIYDIISGILANFSMSNVLKENLNHILKEYVTIDKIEQENYKLLRHYLKTKWGEEPDYIINKLKITDLWDGKDGDFRKLSMRLKCNTLPTIMELVSPDDYKKLRSEVDRRTKESITNYKREQNKISLDVIDFSDDEIAITGLPILKIAINHIISNNLTIEHLTAHKTDFCLGLIYKIKDFYISEKGEQAWNDGPRSYFNNLYAHMKDILVPFDVKAIDNPELSAIAAFLLRGQSIDYYFVFLKMNEFSDYSCPLMLWGALCGYMEMNRDSLSQVLSMEKYEMVYKKLFGSPLAIISEFQRDEDFDSTLFHKLLVICKYDKSDLLTKKIVAKKNDNDSLEEILETILNDKPFKRASKQCGIARNVMKIYLTRGDEHLVRPLIKELNTNKKQREVLNLLGYSSDRAKTTKKKNICGDLFPDKESKVEAPVTTELPELPCFTGLDEKVICRIKDYWNYTGNIHVNDIKEHISHFVNLCKKEGREGNNKGPAPLKDIFTEALANQVKQELKGVYGIK